MLEGAMEPKMIASNAATLGFPAIALTDRNGLYAAMPFTDACVDKGVQPVVGALLAVARPLELGTDGIDWLVLLAKDERGYGNLCKLVSAAHLDRPLSEDPHVPFARLEELNDGLIAMTAGGEGTLARLLADGQRDKAAIYLDRLEQLFPERLYVELTRRGDPIEQAAEDALIDLAYSRDLPLVATNPAAYADPSFHAAHDAMLCIANSAYVESAERIVSSADAWLKDEAAMIELFIDIPEAIDNTAVIAQRCAVGAPKRRPILPRLSDQEDWQLRRDARAGLAERMASRSEDDCARYRERLDYELEIIINMGFASYFLIVADFIKWAKANDIPVGPGRGSGAGSVVAWSLTITDLDPID
ncbi:MAG: PHP domain-containing protein, partial [Pseudomonadota bacterium]|nr:PHP domain-containing protein [Pseudomonadota bacterium]